MNDQLLLVGEDSFFSSSALPVHSTIQVKTSAEAISLLERHDFQAVVARDGADILNALRGQGKHTPFLNITFGAAVRDCCGGGMSPDASLEEKASALRSLMARNHDFDCV